MKEEKRILRKKMKQAIMAMSEKERAIKSLSVITELENDPVFKQAKTILSFWSLADEIDTHRFNNRWKEEKKILLPVVMGDDMELRPFLGEEAMQTGAFNIQEPTGAAFDNLNDIDLVVVPGVAFSRNGNRLGRGRGFYDRLLQKIRNANLLSENNNKHCHTIAICFPCQICESLPTEAWDEKVEKVIW